LGLALSLLLSFQIAGASEPVFETDEQFEAGRALRDEGMKAFRAGDAKAALLKMEEALGNRPNNTQLLGFVIFLAVQLDDADRAAEAATLYAASGQAPSAGIQRGLSLLLAAERWAPLKIAFEANVAAKGKATLVYSVPTDMKLIEGIAAAPDGTLFVSSVVSGALYALEGETPRLIADGKAYGMDSFFGITFDAKRGSLLATYGWVPQSTSGSATVSKTGVAEFDATTGALKNNWVLDGTAEKHQIADILVGRDGTIFASDASGRAVYKVSGDALEKAFDLPGSLSPQGMAETASGDLILSDWGRGLWRLDRASGSVSALGAPMGTHLVGIDGLVIHQGKLIGIQNAGTPQRLIEIVISKDGKSVTSVQSIGQMLDGFDEPTLGVSTPTGFYFVAGSQWPKFAAGGALRDGASHKETAILKLQ
ncbi:MAG: hypothetical protein COB37_08145, partial [Kordiimonadales bacterium]